MYVYAACTRTYVWMDFANECDEYDGDDDDDVVAIWLISFTLWLEQSQSLVSYLNMQNRFCCCCTFVYFLVPGCLCLGLVFILDWAQHIFSTLTGLK